MLFAYLVVSGLHCWQDGGWRTNSYVRKVLGLHADVRRPSTYRIRLYCSSL